MREKYQRRRRDCSHEANKQNVESNNTFRNENNTQKRNDKCAVYGENVVENNTTHQPE